MNWERHAPSIELCLTISKAEASLRFPSQKSQLRPYPRRRLCGPLDSKKKTTKKKKKKEEQKKNATNTNKQLYQKNYPCGPKDKCSETKFFAQFSFFFSDEFLDFFYFIVNWE